MSEPGLNWMANKSMTLPILCVFLERGRFVFCLPMAFLCNKHGEKPVLGDVRRFWHRFDVDFIDFLKTETSPPRGSKCRADRAIVGNSYRTMIELSAVTRNQIA